MVSASLSRLERRPSTLELLAGAGALVNSIVEIHDSELAGTTLIGRDLALRLEPAYVHRSAGRPGIDRGSGWLQDIDLVISEANVESLPAELPAKRRKKKQERHASHRARSGDSD
jgi:hypothetical protein